MEAKKKKVIEVVAVVVVILAAVLSWAVFHTKKADGPGTKFIYQDF